MERVDLLRVPLDPGYYFSNPRFLVVLIQSLGDIASGRELYITTSVDRCSCNT
jgi:hypothetical protein